MAARRFMSTLINFGTEKEPFIINMDRIISVTTHKNGGYLLRYGVSGAIDDAYYYIHEDRSPVSYRKMTTWIKQNYPAQQE